MSIFKESFKAGIREQIEVRQNAINGVAIVGTPSRTADAMQYYNSRNAWIKMQSGVNVGGTNDLASKYVLQGGILTPSSNLIRNLNIGQNHAYSAISPNSETYRLGIRPMPGITSIDVKSKSAFGSLREVTVKYQCWDIQQLEDLELLYMRPGYTALVEWGWVPYLDNNSKFQSTRAYGLDLIAAAGYTKEQIWKKIYEKSAENGNYDAVYGFIKNYQWSARADGGYDCTTTIITMGEIIESLKINYGAYDTPAVESGVLGLSATSAFATPDMPVPKAYSINILSGILMEMFTSALLINSKLYGYPKTDAPQVNPNKEGNLGSNFNFGCFRWDLNMEHGRNPGTAFANNATNIYIRMRDFVQLLNTFVLIHDTGASGTRTKPIVEFSIKEGAIHQNGDDLLCLSHPFQLSTDPTVCIIKNDRWKGTNPFGITIGPPNPLDLIMSGLKSDYFKTDASNPDVEFGVIGNIYLNLGYLYSLASNGELEGYDKKEKNDIAIFDYMKSVLAGVNTALGNVANLDIMVDPVDSIARIIDVNYVDLKKRDDVYKNAFIFELHNTKSIVRSYKLESQIFPEQSTIVAIGAQSKGGALGAETNTMVDFNQGLEDRIVPKREAPNRVKDPNPTKEAEAKIKNLKNSLQVITNFITALIPGFWSYSGDFDSKESSKYANALKDIIQFMKSLTGDDNKNRAIIPTKLSMEMDGIGGIIIGNIFRIPDDLLPRGYRGGGTGTPGPTKIAYVVTGIGHSIQNNDWKTNIDAQIILLDEPKNNKNTPYPNTTDALNMVASIVQNMSTSGGGGGRGSSTTPRNTNLFPNTAAATSNYIFGTAKSGLPISTPAHPPWGGLPFIWQNNNAWDLGIAAGTPVYAVVAGTISDVKFSENFNTVWGYNVTVNGSSNTFFHTHLDHAVVANGASVAKGQLIGYVGQWPADYTRLATYPHLHIGVKTGPLSNYIDSTGKIK
jgi:hypothetical protein